MLPAGPGRGRGASDQDREAHRRDGGALLVVILADAITTFVQNGFSWLAVISPLIGIAICVVATPLLARQGIATQNPGCMVTAVVGHFANTVCSTLGIVGLWWAASTVQTWCSQYNCDAQFVNGTECVIAVAGWGGRITTQTIPEGSCDGYGAAPIVGTLILLILIVLSMYTGVVSCKLKPLLQVIPNMPGAQVVGTNAQVQIVTQPQVVQVVQPTIVTASVVKAA